MHIHITESGKPNEPLSPSAFETVDPGAHVSVKDVTGYVTEHYNSAYNQTVNLSPDTFKVEYRDPDSNEPFLYQKYFAGKDHQNFNGVHPELGNVIVSLRKESLYFPEAKSIGLSILYRAIFRTEEKFIYLQKTHAQLGFNDKKTTKTKHIITALFPVLEKVKLYENRDTALIDALLNLEKDSIETNYKFGILYAKDGQYSEYEMFSNETASPNFQNFLKLMGDVVKLKGYEGFRGGLDVKEDGTGTESVATKYKNMNIMFHVSTFLPFTPNDRQQVKRKAHIGNDVCIIVFKENNGSNVPFNPTSIVSQFPHVYFIIETIPKSTRVRISVCRRADVAPFGPYPSERGVFELNNDLREFILTKCINGENSSYLGKKLGTLRRRTRKTLLTNIVTSFKDTSLKSSLSLSSSLSSLRSSIKNLYSPKASSKPTLLDDDNPIKEEQEVTNDKDTKEESVKDNESITANDFLREEESVVNMVAAKGLLLNRKSLTILPTGTMVFEKNNITNSTTSLDYYSKLENLTAQVEKLQSALQTCQKEKDMVYRENAELKNIVDQLEAEEIDRIDLENSKLKLQVELKETRVKLLRAKVFIQNMKKAAETLVEPE